MKIATLAPLALAIACTQSPGSVTATASLDDGGQEGSGGSGDATSASSSSSSSGSTAGSISTSSGASESTAPASGDGSSESGSIEMVCDHPSFFCAEPIECGSRCGTLDALFDEDGCLRRECVAHEECGSSEACYRAMDFGGCAPSGAACDEVDGDCVCGSNPDCGGSRCVPIDLYPVPIQPGPDGPGVAERTCGPGDALSLTLRLGADIDACADADAPELRIEVSSYIPGNVFYSIDDDVHAWDEADIAATGGHFFLSDEVGGVVSGDYNILFADRELFGSFADLPVCPCE